MDRTVARRAAVAFGSNLGDRHAALAFAAHRLAPLLAPLIVSDPVETEPVGDGAAGQPLYLNAVFVGEATLDAPALLDALLSIECAWGRERPFPGAPRTLDLDLILLGDVVIDSTGLQVPHPRFRERFFVLGPLAEVAPDVVDPVSGLKAWELLRNLLRDETR